MMPAGRTRGFDIQALFIFIFTFINLFIASQLGRLILASSFLGMVFYALGAGWGIWVSLFSKKRGFGLPGSMKIRKLASFALLTAMSLAGVVYGFVCFPAVKVCMLLGTAAVLSLQQAVPGWLLKKGRRLWKSIAAAAAELLGIAAVWGITYIVSPREGITDILLLMFWCGILRCVLTISRAPAGELSRHRAGSKQVEEFFRMASFSLFQKTLRAYEIAGLGFLLLFAGYSGWKEGLLAVLGSLAFLCLSCFFFYEVCRAFFRKYPHSSLLHGVALGTVSLIAAGFSILLIPAVSDFVFQCIVILLAGFGGGCIFAAFRRLEREFRLLAMEEAAEYSEAAFDGCFAITLKWTACQGVLAFVLGELLLESGIFPINEHMVGEIAFWVILGLSVLYLLTGLFRSCRQPLNREYSYKLRIFLEEKREGINNIPLKNRLRTRLVLPYKKKIGFMTAEYLLSLVLPSKVVGMDKINFTHGPAVFVCNHMEIYGPLITALHLPFPVRTWIIHSMLDRTIIEQQLQGGVDKVCRIFPEGIRKKIPRLISPMMMWIMTSIENIPVYRGSTHEVMKTMRATVEAMECYDNILIFPENSGAQGEDGVYKTEGISAFFSGFSKIGSSYYKATGKHTIFYPMYADRKKHRIFIGDGIEFDPSHKSADEKCRIVNYLHDTMEELSKN